MNSQTNPVIVMNTIKSMQQQIKLLTERISRSSSSGGSLDKITFEIKAYEKNGEDGFIYYSPLSLSERANLFSKITGRELCVVGFIYRSDDDNKTASYTGSLTPSSVINRFGLSFIEVTEDRMGFGTWMLFYDDATIDENRSYHAGDVLTAQSQGEDTVQVLVTSELPGDDYTPRLTYFFDFYA